MGVMLLEPVLGISHQAGLETGQGSERRCVAVVGNAEQPLGLG